MISEINRTKALSPDERDRYIVESLRSAECPVSGEALALELGMSRVALWKRIESLKAWGYGIEASRKGYELVNDDGLAGWELDAPGPVLLFDTVGSTMDEARALAEAGSPSGATVLALGQKAGRGRSGSAWVSPSGGLYLSVVIRSSLPLSHAGALSLEAAALTVSALKSAGAPSVSFRWPGDIVAGLGDGARPGKVGGVLVEAYGDISASDYYVVGLGLGVSPEALAGDARHTLRRAELAAAIVRSLVAWADRPVLEQGRWDELAPPKGWPVSIELWTGERIAVMPAGFNSRGELLSADGLTAVSAGECRRIAIEGDLL